MAEENRSESPSVAHVAYNLMQFIGIKEEIQGQTRQDRTYWLSLYHQCYKAAYGRPLKQILEDEPQK